MMARFWSLKSTAKPYPLPKKKRWPNVAANAASTRRIASVVANVIEAKIDVNAMVEGRNAEKGIRARTVEVRRWW